MKTYVVLLRGINVGGHNKVPMGALKSCLEEDGFADVRTYIQSGNVIVRSPLAAKAVGTRIEACLAKQFATDNVRVLVLTRQQLAAVVAKKPKGFGDQPTKYNCDVIFLMGLAPADVLPVFDPRTGVDTIWPGTGVIYSQRLSAKRTQSRLSKAMSSPAYKSMTIRNWNTTTKLLAMLDE
jgi:uncharacterized protein (DUF1697 family)